MSDTMERRRERRVLGLKMTDTQREWKGEKG